MGESHATIRPALDGLPSLSSVQFDLGSVGYAAREHFATGTAQSYTEARPFTPDGRWDVEPAERAEYTTRCVVYHPTDVAHASGTLVLEWLNVTGGLDIPALWMPTHRHLVRTGASWVGVSAQRVGIEGGGIMPGLGLRQVSPERYGRLELPDDAYSYDIFTQVARSVRSFLPERYGIPVDRVIAAGASQSAVHLTTYVNAIDAHARAVDGFLLQGRAGAGASIRGWNLDRIASDEAFDADVRQRRLHGRDQIREDARAPVMVVQSETDVFGSLGSLSARQADSDRFRLWEVAGAAHCDTYFLCAAPHDSGRLPVDELAALIARADSSGIPTTKPMNAGPQMHFVLQGALDALDRWIRHGTEPPSAARLELDAEGGLGRDDVGIGRGGVRTPWVDVPLEVFSGLGQPGGMTELFGTTRALDAATIDALYPRGRDDFVRRFAAATSAAVEKRFLVPEDAAEVEGLGVAVWG
jgi:hypothetical protein